MQPARVLGLVAAALVAVVAACSTETEIPQSESSNPTIDLITPSPDVDTNRPIPVTNDTDDTDVMDTDDTDVLDTDDTDVVDTDVVDTDTDTDLPPV
ncbi:MAG: hypothetical protein H6733_04675 [Alphaproteobacteria bacterium]|nr:hypothetical protein [Alphaproteobacteria bacterium]